MKKLFLFAMILFAAISSQAQWEPDVRLTNDPDSSITSYPMSWSIAANGDVVHVLWCDNRDGDWEIYYKRSADGGVTWGDDTRLTYASGISRNPSIAVSGDVVHAVWTDFRDGNGNREIYYKRSTDGGLTWAADQRLTYEYIISYEPSLAVFGSDVHVVWTSSFSGDYKIYYKHSTDGGITWGDDVQLTNNIKSYNPSIAITGTNVHVTWNDERDGNLEIYYKRSTDGGLTWDSDTRLTSDPFDSNFPSIAVYGSNVHIVFIDNRDFTSREIYYKRSTDGGISWETDTRLTNDPADSYRPNIALSGSAVHVVWMDSRDGDYRIYYKRSDDGGTNWTADALLTEPDAPYSHNPSIAVSGPVVHVVWNEYIEYTNYEVFYKRNPTGGFPVGIENNLTGSSGQPFNIYPNPASTLLNIFLNSSLNEDLALRIIDLSGRTFGIYKFHSSTGLNQYSIDLNGYSNGLYFIEFTTGGVKYFRKLVISK